MLPVTLLVWVVVYYLAPPGEARPQMLVVLVDGLRWDSLNDLPALEKIARSGARAEQLTPCFPSECYPNYYSVATGLYPESHGIVANNMYDVKTGETFKIKKSSPGNRKPRWWEGGEPIWITAIKQGLKVRLYHWPGCDVPIHGLQLSDAQCVPYMSYMDGRHMPSTMDRALDDLAKHDVDLVLMYQEQPDGVQHQYGVNSSHASVVRARLDASLHRLEERASLVPARDHPDEPFMKHVNLMVLSDHGHARLVSDRKRRLVNVTAALNTADVQHVLTSGATVSVWPKDRKDDQVYERLQEVPHLSVYLKADLPDRWHYKHNPLVAPIVGVVDVGHQLITPDSPKEADYSTGPMTSTHGYDNAAKQMAAIFVGAGPNFRPGARVDTLENVHLYQVMCSLLGLTPAPHNGSWDQVAGLLTGLGGNGEKEAPRPAVHTVDSAAAKGSAARLDGSRGVITVMLGIGALYICFGKNRTR